MNATATETRPEAILELQGMTMLYPGTVALSGVGFDVRQGECHGVIGKNGAGKTTLMKIISGLIAPTEGRMFLRGRPVKAMSRRKSRAEGISIVTQEPQVIPDFTVAENLFYPDYIRRHLGRIDWAATFQRAEETVTRAGFHLNVRAKGADLSISEQQLLLVLKAFFVDRAQVVILDEVTAALTRTDQEFLYAIIERQKKLGQAILFISHRLGEILAVCDRVTVLRDGRKITTEPVANLNETDLSRLIVGEDQVHGTHPSAKRVDRAAGSADPLLAVRGLSRAGQFRDVSFSLRRGEILGLAGLRGSGRTEILKTLAGVLIPDEGALSLAGKIRRWSSPARALREGVVYLPEDRDQEGLIEILSVKHNLTLACLDTMTRLGLIDRRQEERSALDMIRALAVRAASAEQEVHSLSGGNRQKVVIGKLMAAHPQVYLLDEPTKGIDIGAKRAVLDLVRDRLSLEAGVILTSPGLEDLMGICDRILVVCQGRITREFARDGFDAGRLYLAMQGADPPDRP